MAEQVLTDFIRALRSAEVRVSTGEAIDAAEAVKLIGYAARTRLSNTLRCVLAKSPSEKATHDRLFDLYFSRRHVPDTAETQDETEASQEDGASEGEQDLLDLVQSGDETQIAIAMERAGQEAEIANIRFSTQISYYAQQMMQALGGLDTWMDHGTMVVDLRDDWPNPFISWVASPWPTNAAKLRVASRFGKDQWRIDFLEGHLEGTSWGGQHWATYAVDRKNQVTFAPDADIWFWVPTTSYFFEAPFELAKADCTF